MGQLDTHQTWRADRPLLTATAADADGNTSEFSAPVSLPQVTPLWPLYLPPPLHFANRSFINFSYP